ncbi:hypothetical protein Hypma_013688 [Hypsizygus marmoreus]|uniref:F-box domain-containing protein n=1 Tax=Hypsizygus marmoreus TaxID=39966 RepID=A0A369JKX8_HYPMA|nr:hypothetical protein Hypma_013688 [Hypsizygus marmoreus]
MHLAIEFRSAPKHSTLDCFLNQYDQRHPRDPPIYRIPVELLSEVFKHCLDDPSDGTSLGSSFTTMPATHFNPFLLGHVCSYWRTLSISMPTLWSTLAVFCPNPSLLPLIRLWLSRTADRPLTLSLFQPSICNDMPNTAVNETLALFLGLVPRWRSIDFVFGDQDDGVFEQLRAFPADTASMLESVRFVSNRWEYTLTDIVWGQFHMVSSLRRVDWGPTYLGFVIPHDVPWAQLTHVNMCLESGALNLDLDKFLDVLGQCKELVELECQILLPLESSPQPKDVVVPRLCMLRLHVHGEEPGPLLRHIKLPSLVSLHIVNVFDSPSEGPQSRLAPYVIDLLTRSDCRLKTFSLYDPDLMEHELLQFLSSPVAQSLVNVELKAGCYVSDQTIKLLTHAEGHSKCLPNLDVLKLPRCLISEGVLSGMLTSHGKNIEKLISGCVQHP